MTVLLLKRALRRTSRGNETSHTKRPLLIIARVLFQNSPNQWIPFGGSRLSIHDDPLSALFGYRKHMDIHGRASTPFVPCLLRTRLQGIVNNDKFVTGATLAKRKVVAVTIIHRKGIRKLVPMGARVELGYNRSNFHILGAHQVRYLPTRSTPQQEQPSLPRRGEGTIANRSSSPPVSRHRPGPRPVRMR